MKYKEVTAGQADQVRRIANAKQIGSHRFQAAIQDGRFGMFLNTLKEEEILAPDNVDEAAKTACTQKDDQALYDVIAFLREYPTDLHRFALRLHSLHADSLQYCYSVALLLAKALGFQIRDVGGEEWEQGLKRQFEEMETASILNNKR